MSRAAGSVDNSEYFAIVDDIGGDEPGEPKTGLDISHIDSAYFVRERGTPVEITPLSNLTNANDAHSDGGFIEVDETKVPGLYRFDVPDAAYALGTQIVSVQINFTLPANALARPLKIPLVSYTGARTITVTVDDGTDPLEGATVRLTKGGESHVRTSDASGQCVFNINDGSWTVAITLSGYTFAGDTLVVTGDATPTYSMSVSLITSPDPNQVTGHYTCYDESGSLESGVTVTLTLIRASSTAGLACDNTPRTVTSGGAGIATFPGLFKGATYRVKRGTSAKEFDVKISDTAPDPVALDSIIGKP